MHSMAKIVVELNQQRAMQLQAPVHTKPELGDLIDGAANATAEKYANAALIAKDRCFEIMRHYSPLQIPREKRRNFLVLLMQQVASQNLEELYFVTASRKKLKMDYLDVIRELPHSNDREMRLVMDVGLQALCKDTALGRVFHLQRKGTAPNIKHGQLEILALYLNQIAQNREVKDLHPNTQAALQAECLRSKSFKRTLRDKYPQIYNWAQPALEAVVEGKEKAKATIPLRPL